MANREKAVITALCPQCRRVLFNRLFDVCQYCSAPLPPHLCLSEAEKAPLREQVRKDAKQGQLRRRGADRTTSPDGWSAAFTELGDVGGGGGGDCGDGGGGGCD